MGRVPCRARASPTTSCAHFAIPLVACVWSCGDLDAASYPARHLFRFLDHHGMLTVTGSPTVAHRHRRVGHLRRPARRAPARRAQGEPGDRGDAARRRCRRARARRAAPATLRPRRRRHARRPGPRPARRRDARREARPRRAIRYSRNETWLHRDSSVLPKPRQAKASWNYRMHACDAPAPDVTVSYWMNRLHGITDADDHVVTLNPAGSVDESLVTARMSYDHPIFTREAVEAASRLREGGGDRLAFAGAHLGLGLPRGRVPLRRGSRRVLRGALVTAVLTPPAGARARRRHRGPLAPHAAAPQLHPRPLPVARRRRRPAPTPLADKAARPLRRPRPPRRRVGSAAASAVTSSGSSRRAA